MFILIISELSFLFNHFLHFTTLYIVGLPLMGSILSIVFVIIQMKKTSYLKKILTLKMQFGILGIPGIPNYG